MTPTPQPGTTTPGPQPGTTTAPVDLPSHQPGITTPTMPHPDITTRPALNPKSTLEVDVVRMQAGAKAWELGSGTLTEAARLASGLTSSQTNMGLFQATWDAYTKCATYLHDRLNEGSAELDNIATTLDHCRQAYLDQEQRTAKSISNVPGDHGY